MNTYKNSKIKSVKAREILDSRGNPTIEVDLITNQGLFQTSVPSGVSKGKYEAVELRDGGKRYQGKGVMKAVENVNKIIGPELKGKNPVRQKEIDSLMIKLDGTRNKLKLGANAVLAVSQACCRAGAKSLNLPLYRYISRLAGDRTSIRLSLPAPSVLIIEGGAHAGNELDFQEFMIVPQVKPFSKALQLASEIYHQSKILIGQKYVDLAVNVGDEGGFAPPARVPEEALNLILKAARNLGYQNKIKIILDIAASQFFVNGKYKMKFGVFTPEGLLRYYSDLVQKYPVSGLEDPFSEEDWEGFQEITKKFGKKIAIIGDDLLVTNPERIKEAYDKKASNAIILKPNQIGTMTEAIEAGRLAKSYSWKVFVKHRGGETTDDFIADLAVGLGADGIMTGAPARGERVAKYNRLLRIEEGLKNKKYV
jgi:enolase